MYLPEGLEDTPWQNQRVSDITVEKFGGCQAPLAPGQTQTQALSYVYVPKKTFAHTNLINKDKSK